MTANDAEFQKYADALSRRIAWVLDGEPTVDVISVLSGLCAYGIREAYAPADRQKALGRIVRFMEIVISQPELAG
jgi:hypothetical protein